MGADNIIKAEMITPQRDQVTVNACQNQDLFWAIRGGGGGTFGVTLSVTMNAHQSFHRSQERNHIGCMVWTGRKEPPVSGATPGLRSGIHGYYTMGGSPPAMNGSLLLYNAQNGTAERLLSPIQDFLRAHDDSVESTVKSLMTAPCYDIVQTMPAIESAGTTQGAKASRLIPRRAVIENVGIFARTLKDLMPSDDSSKVS
ncbi:uncharacterized protein BO66DRAFT_82520 [Aspergillus aculeatinus CBS 121060]|uniref:Uncharacterized protein n=1 Tax=Aspergillus aculeatinus CBS 121060 TaxID=1448322 RepID=A0ACD1HA84_9EURO|nr:hypothetical protein BO66DRAFT_82520 [Aspergillus aculeatinus CBS 121060]RAH70545.1 hypothetical protein BO66DRAFT_82520 [Aspergillus aculeatinus CBS 121060]